MRVVHSHNHDVKLRWKGGCLESRIEFLDRSISIGLAMKVSKDISSCPCLCLFYVCVYQCVTTAQDGSGREAESFVHCSSSSLYSIAIPPFSAAGLAPTELSCDRCLTCALIPYCHYALADRLVALRLITGCVALQARSRGFGRPSGV